ncbi:Dihydroxyacetone kinase 1 [Taphrina deformans PYCC 5710]|uniref:Dihydroxyacetone kinase 1 n=1 Tax=Taphrina deformans (strain PYCC 5710 / ATCC 11124 / CBS 356.35 / IMI 108563 / JCM 9778 / NBRC 8474) TaxID=1097556 RepID=R4X742_TAPDE|nr:Dihydroxyacetone kinase 1 [Taphrina deformans PYCC 5710]|eukprot:CCG81097.1 Dihydroxyacetone kinase 1 [Taphrina deformans PYCC 5710]
MGSGKHLLDENIDNLIITALRGLARCNPALILDPTHRVAYIKSSQSRVHLVSGGGSGHEPGSAGFVGENLLDCAVSGDVFASPSAAAVTAGIRALTPHPVLVVILNYTGDRLHFGIAIENANRLGQQVEFVVVADDVSVGKTQGGRVGRRGLAGILLVQKVAAGCAVSGKDLMEVKALAEEVTHNLVTVGASLTHASVPGSTGEEIDLGSDEIEIGMGIHNEPGFKKIKTPKISDLSRLLLKQLLAQDDKERSFVPFKSGDEVVLLINNLGGISALELYHFTQIVSSQVETDWELKIVRTYAGSFVTSLDGAGVSITLLNVSNIKESSVLLEHLDLPSTAPGWNNALKASAWAAKAEEVATRTEVKEKSRVDISIDSKTTRTLIEGACKSLVASESEITKYDTVAGDGDAGLTLKSAAESVLAAIEANKISLSNLVDTFGDIASVLEAKMGGTGGALYTIFFNALSSSLNNESDRQADASLLAQTIHNAVGRLQTYTTAIVGDKTLMDALLPFSETFVKTGSFEAAVEAGKKGATSTKGMAAGLGRATYVDKSAASTVPDAGAIGVQKLLEGILVNL